MSPLDRQSPGPRSALDRHSALDRQSPYGGHPNADRQTPGKHRGSPDAAPAQHDAGNGYLPEPLPLAAHHIEAIAQRVAELLDERRLASAMAPDPAMEEVLLDAAALARLLGVSRGFVYDHAQELGGRRLGEGSKPRLRFDVDRAREWLTARSATVGSEDRDRAPVARSSRRRSGRSGTGTSLLPIHSSGGARRVP